MKVVTAGLNYLDIDAYAGCVAYAELLNLQGDEAIAFSTANINQSVTRTILSWGAPLVTSYAPSSSDSFILVDVSDPENLEKMVDIDRVEEVIDHHVRYEEYWEAKIGSKSTIEFIGAACTQIYEKWLEAGLLSQMSEVSARLLTSGILDNTLDFKAGVTTNRDKQAYQSLLAIANLPSDWSAQYFRECQTSIFENIADALVNDTKITKLKNLNSGSVAFGQLVIWDANRAIDEYRGVVEETMASISRDWLINVVSISDRKSFLLASSSDVAQWAEKVLGVRFDGGLAVTERLWLRKEIIKRDLDYTQER